MVPDMDKLKMPSRNLPLPGLLISLLLAGCGTSSQDLLLEVRKGEAYSIIDLGQYLSSREAAGEEFSKGDLAAIELLRDVAGTDPVVANRMRAIAALADLESIHQCLEIGILGGSMGGRQGDNRPPGPGCRAKPHLHAQE